jgi:hypothetical protein
MVIVIHEMVVVWKNGTIPTCAWKDWGKQWKSSVIMLYTQAKNRILEPSNIYLIAPGFATL